MHDFKVNIVPIPGVFAGLLIMVLILGCEHNETYKPFIAVDLVGYPSDGLKEAFLVNINEDSLVLFNEDTQEVVAHLMIIERKKPDVATGDSVNVINFSTFDSPGIYTIRTTGKDKHRSEVFRINDSLYKDVVKTVLQSYYYHRCGTKVESQSHWEYSACHLDDAPFYYEKSKFQDVSGGWHDAGDYNKFSVNTSLSAALLLYLYEDFSGNFYDGQLDIPERGNGIPDILDEVKWALDWLIKMQKTDGGIYHKVSQEKWIGEYLPNNDPSKRYIFEVSSAATASFAATASLAARMFKEYDLNYSEKLESSALNAWRFLELNPHNVPLGGFVNPPNVSGGEYGDRNDRDERVWAAVELFKMTERIEFKDYVKVNLESVLTNNHSPISWRNVNSLALNSILSIENSSDLDLIKSRIRESLIKRASDIIKVQERNNYKNLNKHTEYYWGSNSVGLAYAFDLIKAYELTGNTDFLSSAYDQLHFVLGRNPFNKSQITGIGTNSVSNPYHQLSELDEVELPVPGMLVGGPNNHLHLNGNVISEFPAKNYQDKFNNYLVNEVAINYTAMLAYVSGYLAFVEQNK